MAKTIKRLFDYFFNIKMSGFRYICFVFVIMSLVMLRVGLDTVSETTTTFETYVIAFIILVYLLGIFSYVYFLADGFIFIAWIVSVLFIVTNNPTFLETGAIIFVVGFIISITYKFIRKRVEKHG